MTALTDYIRIFQARGVKRTVAELIENGLYDWYWAVDTQTVLPLSDYSNALPAKEHAVLYQPAYRSVINHALTQALPHCSLPGSFIDYGCGKGKVCLQAHAHPFTRVIGVELNPELSKIAEHNAVSRFGKTHHIEIVTTDCRKFAPPKDTACIFLFNPFDKSVLETVIENLETHCEHPVVAIYVNPVHADCFSHWQHITDLEHFDQPASLFKSNS